MGVRFYRRMRVFPGISVNLSKSGASMSFGVRGAHYTVGPRGRRVTVGLPGSGLYYTQHEPSGRAAARPGNGSAPSSGEAPLSPAVAAAGRCELGFFRRLVTPLEERELVDGLRELVAGNEESALAHFRKSSHRPDGAMLAGILAFKRGSLPEAEQLLTAAARAGDRLGLDLNRYGISSTVSMQLTPDVVAHLPSTRGGALLALAEVFQREGKGAEAIACLRELHAASADDAIVTASLCELWLDDTSGAELAAVVTATDALQNTTPVHTALFLYRTEALRRQKLPSAAITAATAGLSRKVDRPAHLLHALRYERALAYAEAGDARRARADLERIYAEDAAFADVATRLSAPQAAAPSQGE